MVLKINSSETLKFDMLTLYRFINIEFLLKTIAQRRKIQECTATTYRQICAKAYLSPKRIFQPLGKQ